MLVQPLELYFFYFLFFCRAAQSLLLVPKLPKESCQAALKARFIIQTTKSRIKATYYFGGFGQDRNDARKPD